MRANWIQETTTTTGAGTITLGGASSGFVSFADQFGDGEAVFYAIEDGTNRESGIGKFITTGTTLERVTVLETLVSGVLDNTFPAAINLSGSAVVICPALEQNFGAHPRQEVNSFRFIAIKGALGGEGTGSALSVGNFFASPVRIEVAGFHDAIMIQVDVAVAGTMRVGLATVNKDLSIGAYLAESADIDTSTTGDKTALFTSKFLHVGDYYMVLCSNTTAAVPHRDRRHMGGENFVGRQGSIQRVIPAMLGAVASPPTFPATPPSLSPNSKTPDMMLRRA